MIIEKDKNTISQEKDLDDQINKIRQKTFNDELRTLVNKITIENNNRYVDQNEINKSSEKENLLITIHKLFYKTINLNKFNTINKNFNPFYQKTITNINSIENTIIKEYKKLDITKFAFLNYSVNKKCFIPVLNTLFTDNPEYLSLSITEKIIQKLFNSKNGELINVNCFLNKYNNPNMLDEKSNNNLLVISLNNIIPKLWSKFLHINQKYRKVIIPPILIMDIEGSDKNYLFNQLTKKLNILLYLYYLNVTEKQALNYTNISYNDIYQLFNLDNNHNGYLIEYKGKFNNELFIIIKKLYKKLNQSLSESSNIIYYEKNRIILFLDINDENIAKKILDDFNKLYFSLFKFKRL